MVVSKYIIQKRNRKKNRKKHRKKNRKKTRQHLSLEKKRKNLKKDKNSINTVVSQQICQTFSFWFERHSDELF